MNAQVFPILIRRELWEHRVLWMTPVVLVALYIAGCLLLGHATVTNVNINVPRDTAPLGGKFLFPMVQLGSTTVIFVLMSVVIFFYLSDCLFAERKDRSILFWKSLPVSDSATVLSKLAVALIVVPLGIYALAALANLFAYVILSFWSRNSPMGHMLGWDTVTWLKLNGLLILDIFIAALWFAPVAAYQLLISAWARTNVFVWTVLPPLALALVEGLWIRHWLIGKFILNWLSFEPPLTGSVDHDINGANDGEAVAALMRAVNAASLLVTPEIWIGAAVAAVLIYGTIRIRRHRDDS